VLLGAAFQHLEQLAGPQPLADTRVRAHLKVPGPRDRDERVDALQNRLERLGLAVLDRYCREAHPMMDWHGVSRFVEVITRDAVVPNARRLEHAHARLIELEYALDYEHPEPRVRERFPRLRHAEARFAKVDERIERAKRNGKGPDLRLMAEHARAQADMVEQAVRCGYVLSPVEPSPAELRKLASKITDDADGVRRYKASPEQIEQLCAGASARRDLVKRVQPGQGQREGTIYKPGSAPTRAVGVAAHIATRRVNRSIPGWY
jgi:hypothetical protein